MIIGLAVSSAAHAAAVGRLSGTVVDDQGQPVPGIELRFVPPPESSNAERTLKTNKKGKFQHAFFPTGSYTIEVVAGDRFIKSMTYVLRDDSGIELDRAEGDAHPVTGLPPFRLGLGQRVELEVVVATKEFQEDLAQRVAISEAEGPLRKLDETYKNGDMEGVIEQADRLLEKKPELGVAFYLRGMAEAKLERYDAAEASLRRALELVPEQQGIEGGLGTVLIRKGGLLEEQGHADDARATYLETVELLDRELARSPGSVPLLKNRAAALEGAGSPDLAPALETLIAADPDDPSHWIRLAKLHADAGRVDEALDILERMPTSDPRAAASLYNLAVGFFNDGHVEASIRAAVLGTRIDPNMPLLYRLLGRAYLSQDDPENAAAALRRFLELAPDDPEADTERQLLKVAEDQGS